MSPLFPLTFLQRTLWYFWQRGQEDIAYNSNSSVELVGPVDVNIIQRVFETIIERHAALRTTFLEVEGQPMQATRQLEELGFHVTEESFLNHSEATLLSRIQDYFHYKFDLINGPLIKVHMLQLASQRYMMLVSMHHIISDGWSLQNLSREFSIIYNDFASGKPCSLAPLEFQCYDFKEEETGNIDELRTFWLDKLQGELPVLDLPSDRVRPAIKTYEGDNCYLGFSAEEFQCIRYYASKQGCSPFIVLLSALKGLFYRYSNQADIMVGIPMAGRYEVAMEPLIGCFVNTLLMRSTFQPNWSFDEMVSYMQMNFLESFGAQQYTFERLLNDLRLKRDPARSPLFDITVNYLERLVDEGDVHLHGIDMRGYEVPSKNSKYDIEIDFIETTDALRMNFNYNSSLFDAWRMQKMLQDFKCYVFEAIKHPNISIARINFIQASEREQLLEGFNRTARKDIPNDFLSVLSTIVAEKSQHIALKHQQFTWTYGQLAKVSDAIACYLQNSFHVSVGQPIGVLMPHNDWVIPLYIGIMKSGACFIPLNRQYPKQELEQLTRLDHIALVIADPTLFTQEDSSTARVLSLQHIKDEMQPYYGIAPSNVENVAEQTAYIIYTSGSTGTPKGVEVKHASLINYLHWTNDYYYHNESGFNTTLFTSLSSDLTITTLFAPLMRGDVIEVMDGFADEIVANAFAKNSGIKTIKLTPSHINLLPMSTANDSAIEVVIVGGEALLERHVEILRSYNPFIKIYNEYGPTEATVGCIVEDYDAGRPVRSIGMPIANTQIYIVDELMQLQPIGVPGEILIGGDCLAAGYRNNAAMTAARFIDHPFLPNQKVYRTGDIGTWLPAGNIEYLGRSDGQIKIRGYRVEPGEIETIIEKYPGLSKAIVVLHNADKRPFFVAYIITSQPFDEIALRNYVFDKLPEYMVPERFIEIEEVPLASSGKVDKSKLPQINLMQNPGAFSEPTNELEQTLKNIWMQVLKLDNVSIEDNFFEAGGDSISIIRMHQEIVNTLAVQITIVDLFKFNTIRSQGNFLSTKIKVSTVTASDFEV
ncbi:amino acid adenylation domain-containing protein [Chitinophaga skermanii]|uniref:Amino acid adenylation domain-containing protein n=1 Tax=Chitinophaga skermanii TaxID=331697 RepID=A0A327R6D6_9BACT|nr:non-ribosomal peptide synthetase [Chitinophaga skermanii]RAJ11143.1 amino acid adenylation domain-containing protein [Chitinophaga skermanii]